MHRPAHLITWHQPSESYLFTIRGFSLTVVNHSLRDLQRTLDQITLLGQSDAFIKVTVKFYMKAFYSNSHTFLKHWHITTTSLMPTVRTTVRAPTCWMRVGSLSAETSLRQVIECGCLQHNYTNWIIHQLTNHVHNNNQHVTCTWVQ